MRIKVIYQPNDLQEEVNGFCEHLEYTGYKVLDIIVFVDADNITEAIIKYARA